eukprot:TRINITY_DN42966_c0_g1_i1.p1 TRINITY_DN42966_c0_g1~~TRINITY_DN42966_c0_g1_i1.p1  ORF type:complete len:236 (-),score=20.06 TRINITY_DN42966_c0_g1_i1:45-752(-)
MSVGHRGHCSAVASLETGKPLQVLTHHRDTVMCVTASPCGSLVATGSRDTTICLYRVQNTQTPLSPQPLHVLYGHDDEITCLALHTENEVVVSGSKDGTLVIHSYGGRYIRTIQYPHAGGSVDLVVIAAQGVIVAHSSSDLLIHAFTANGRLIASTPSTARLTAMITSHDGKHIITATNTKEVIVRQTDTLAVVVRQMVEANITSISVDSLTTHLFVGCSDGGLDVRVETRSAHL